MSFPSIPNVLRILKYFLFYALGKTVSLSTLDVQAILGVILKDLNANIRKHGEAKSPCLAASMLPIHFFRWLLMSHIDSREVSRRVCYAFFAFSMNERDD